MRNSQVALLLGLTWPSDGLSGEMNCSPSDTLFVEMSCNPIRLTSVTTFKMLWVIGCLLLLASCTTQQSVLYVPTKEVDVQSMELGDVQRWPERMVTMTGRMAPCPESSADVSHALDDFEDALGTTTTLLERGNVKDAILEEWQEQMSGLYDAVSYTHLTLPTKA